MMKELSLHVLDIVENSIRGQADNIEIKLSEDIPRDTLSIRISDDGTGMDKEFLQSIKNPFTTTRTHRKAGMGIPFLNDTCIQCGGNLDIKSTPGKGTTVNALMRHSNIDRPPLGDMASTLVNIFASYPDVNFTYIHTYKGRDSETPAEFSVSTRELNDILEGVPISTPDVYIWVKEYIGESIGELYEDIV